MVRLLIIATSFLFCFSTYAADCGRFKVVKGKVIYKQKGKKKFRKARINKKVCQGDLVKTDKNSRAKIKMADDNEINISPNTDLLIEVYENSQKAVLNVLNGKVRSNVKKKYQDSNASHYRVKTKSAVAGVRGTEFLASFNRNTNQSKVVTFEGEVNVGRVVGGKIVGRVSVKPGQFTSNSPGSDPHPAKEVPPQEFAQMDQETNVADSPRDVSSDAGQADQPTESKEDDSAQKDQNREEPKSNKRQPKAKDKTKSGDSAGIDAPGASPDGSAPVDGEISDGYEGGERGVASVEGDGNAIDSIDGGQRDPASIGGGDIDSALPPPELNNLPEGDMVDFKPPPTFNTIDNIVQQPVVDCLRCNDAVINKKVKLTVIPVLPGG